MLLFYIYSKGSEAVANEENLKGYGFHERTASEQREIAKKAGIASGQARRKKKEIKQIVEQALNSVVPNKKAQKQLEKLGFEPTFQSAIALKVVELATSGNLRAVEALFSLENNKKDNLDKKEQRARIKALELENRKKELALSDNDKTDDALARYFEKLGSEVDNYGTD